MNVDPNAESLSATVAHRLQRKCASVIHIKQPYSLAYSTRDIERMTSLTAGDIQSVHARWNARHLGRSLRPHQLLLWIAGGVLAWFLLRDQEAVRGFAGGAVADVPAWVLYLTGVFVGLAFVGLRGRAIEALTAERQWETYQAGYEQGLRQGVNTALGITPEQERQMDAESHRADLAGLHDVEVEVG
jgi:hypothetical protein